MSLIFSSLLSLVIGTVVGLTQKRIKRLFAFSTISHVGFILLALCIHSIESTQAFIFYLMQYSISNLNAFFLLIAIGYSFYFYVDRVNNDYDGTDQHIMYSPSDFEKQGLTYTIELRADDQYVNVIRENLYFAVIRRGGHIEKRIQGEWDDKTGLFKPDNYEDINMLFGHNAGEYPNLQDRNNSSNLQDLNNSPIQLISQLKGYYSINPMLALSLSITLFSFIGVPPLIGFFGKQMILSSALDSGYVFMSLVAILTSVISAVYYLVIIKQIFFDDLDYIINPLLNSLNLKGLIVNKRSVVEEVNIKRPSFVISSSLSLPISVLTLIIGLFIFIPQE